MIDIELGQIWRAKDPGHVLNNRADWRVTYIVDDAGQTCNLKCLQDPRQAKRSNRYLLNTYSTLVGGETKDYQFVEVAMPVAVVPHHVREIQKYLPPEEKLSAWELHCLKRCKVTNHRRLVDEARGIKLAQDRKFAKIEIQLDRSYAAFPSWTDGKEW